MTDFATLGIRAETSDLRTAQDELRGLTRTGADTERRVGGSMDLLAGHWRRMARAAGAALGAIAGAVGFSASIREAEQYELRLNRINAILRATGGVAGRTSQQLEAQAQSLARATLESVDGVMQAQQVLLTFRNVQGEVFDRAIESAADLAAAMGGDVVSATRQIARALEDPIQGVTALTRSGTVFTQQQRDMIRAMVEAGNTAGAQALILSELEGQYGGAARAVPRLSAAQDSLGQSMENLRRAISDSTGASRAWAAVIEATDSIVQAISANIDSFRGYIIAAALAITAYYTPAIVAATFQTGLWIASLITLRGALIATGIGAFIVAAGMLVNWFIKLIENTGGWGNALNLLGEVASGVWEGIKTSAKAIGPALNAVWHTVAAGFYSMLSGLSETWSRFLSGLSASVADVPGFGWAADALSGFSADAMGSSARFDGQAVRATSDALIAQGEAASMAAQGFDTARDAVGRLMDAVNGLGEFAPDDIEGVSAAVNEMNAALDAVAGSGGGARRAADAIDDVTRATEDATRAQEQWAQSMAGHFDGLITGGKGLRGVLQSIARQLESRGWQALFSGFGGGGGGGFLSSLFAGFFDGGGNIPRGQFGMVAEKRPEFVNGVLVPGPANVVGGAETARRMGGGGEPVQVVVRVMPSGEFDARVESTARAVVRVEGPKQIGAAFGKARENRAFG
jgi:hypothetical protein